MSNPLIEKAARTLRSGGLVAFPTETVYGLGANGLDPVAVARIFQAKARPLFDPVILHVPDAASLEDLTADITDTASKLIDAFWPGPLTLVVPKSARVPGIVTAGLDSVAVRSPSHPVARELLVAARVPVAAPSANTFGRLSPTRAEHVRADLGDAIEMILDGGACEWGVESTIVDVTGAVPVVLRYGAVSVEAINEVVGPVQVRVASSSRPSAPGQLESHYAPRTPLVLVEQLPDDRSASACLGFRHLPDGAVGDVLSETGSLVQAAARLFDVLHRLDSAGFDCIYAQQVPDQGLGRAINDRLRRAASRRGED